MPAPEGSPKSFPDSFDMLEQLLAKDVQKEKVWLYLNLAVVSTGVLRTYVRTYVAFEMR